jgi:endonuclease YncB( thermonuclease family)
MSTKHPIRIFPYATIYNVVDGDTCDIELDLGFTVKVKTRFRLAHLNAPEVGTPGGAASTEFLKGFLGKPVVVESTKTDKYGRYLAVLTVDGLNINQFMLDNQLAVPYEGQ